MTSTTGTSRNSLRPEDAGTEGVLSLEKRGVYFMDPSGDAMEVLTRSE